MLSQVRSCQENGDPVSQRYMRQSILEILRCIVAQACMNVAAALGACMGPLIIGALTKANQHTGWRKFYVSSFILASLSNSTLTHLAVGSDGTLGRNCTRPLLRLQASEKTHPVGSLVLLAKAWSPRSRWMRTPDRWPYFTADRTQPGRWPFCVG
jgi:hypothetical protein